MVFELVLNAGPDRTVAERVAEQLALVPPLLAGRHHVSLVPAQTRAVKGVDGAEYYEVFVMAAGVGHRTSFDADWERLALDPDDLADLAAGLYEVLRGCRGYRAAFVGWNPENLVDTAELDQDWAEELRDGTLHGLVLADETLHRLRAAASVEPFSPGFSWIPYQGRRSGAS